MALATRDQADTILNFSVKARIWALDERLQAAVEEFAAAAADLCEKDGWLRTCQQAQEEHETTLRATLLTAGIEGKNEAERNARLKLAFQEDSQLHTDRQLVESATRAKMRADHCYRVADIAHKSLRARLYALAATLGAEQ